MEEDYILLSGIQHFVYCRRQWALIHVEDQWVENERTISGQLFHRNAHDEKKFEKRGDLIIVRGLRIKSDSMKVSGMCDVVEFHRNDEGISLSRYRGCWIPYPVEYKLGKPKLHDADELQLCAEAMCLEEMLLCTIPAGSLFYGKTKRRVMVSFTEAMRDKVKACFTEMHKLSRQGHTPSVKHSKGCEACSLKDICLPELSYVKSVEQYIDESLRANEKIT